MMPAEDNTKLVSGLKLSARLISILVILTGLAVLFGWAFDIQVLKSVLPNLVTMKANTALAFILAGLSLRLFSKKPKHFIGRICALAVALIGILTLSEYLFGLNFGIDQLLFKEASNAVFTSSPGRMAPATAFNFFLSGLALLFLDTQTRKGFRPSQFLILIQGLISLLSFLGYLYNVKAFYHFGYYTAMAVHTTVLFLILFIGLLFARPDKGFMLVLTSDSPGGILLRKPLPIVIFTLVLLGYLFLLVQRQHFYATESGLVLFVTMIVVILGLIVVDTSKDLYRMDRERREKEEEIISLSKFPSENPYPVLRVDKDGIILYANRACNVFLDGWKCDIGKYIPDFFRTLISKTCSSGLIMQDIEFKSGERVFSFTLAPIAGCTYINLYGVDITERKRIEAEFNKANQELKKLDQLKSDFVSTVSHELRTPMSIAKESVSQVVEGLHGKLTNDQRHFLSISLSNIDRLSRIVNDLLDISKIESGIKLKKELINAVELAKAVIFDFYLKAKAKGIEIKESFSDKKIEVYVDKDRIIQVFTNLIDNAIKFTDKGDITIAITDKKDVVECNISDTGAGISEEDIPKLFAKFQQLRRPDGQGEKGTGLGLAISKGIVELHKDRIWVESVLGKGTKISFTLPKI